MVVNSPLFEHLRSVRCKARLQEASYNRVTCQGLRRACASVLVQPLICNWLFGRRRAR